jgi:hypothetical protein
MNAHGDFGASTNIEIFPFVAASKKKALATYNARPSGLQQGNSKMP